LGILTAVVSAIRIRGNASLRAFVGRGQEGPGDAEQELLSCVSGTTAELFHNGGISRIFGKPKILEVKVTRDPQDPLKLHIESVSKALADKYTSTKSQEQCAESEEGSAESQELIKDFDIPNLSLNKGITRQSRYWTSVACIIGSVLQIGEPIFYPSVHQ
jgi:ankyrin repeat domain-containing protein 50